jgi:hypothetical protein
MRIHRFTRPVARVVAAAAVAAVAVLAVPSPAHAVVYYTLTSYGSNMNAFAQNPFIGTQIRQHAASGLTDDEWVKIPVNGINNTYQLQNRYSNYCLDANGSRTAGTPVVQRGCTNDAYQYWVLTYDASYGAYQVLNLSTGYALSVEFQSSQTGARLVQSRWTHLPTQRWEILVS